MFLSPSQIAELTTRRTKPAQRRQIDALGVKYGMRADGSLVVLESAVEAAIGAPTATKNSRLGSIRQVSRACVALLRLRPACLWAKMNPLSTKHLR